MKVAASLEGLLAWQCGYATGLRVALRYLAESRDPKRHIKSELRGVMLEARRTNRSTDVVAKAD